MYNQDQSAAAWKQQCISDKYPIRSGYMVVSTDPQYTKHPVIYGGVDVVDTFLQRLNDKQREISNISSVEKLMVMTAEDIHRHQQAAKCLICG